MKKFFLKHLLLTSILLSGSSYGLNSEYSKYVIYKKEEINNENISNYFFNSILYDKKISGLYADYLGLDTVDYKKDKNGYFILYDDNKIPIRESLQNDMEIDFEKALYSLYNRKLKKYNNDELVAFNKTINSKYSFNSSTKMSLEDYINEADESIGIVNDNLNWKMVSHKMRLNNLETNVVKNIANELDGYNMISYCLTELFPEKDGSFNSYFLDFLLKNAGREYVELLPALYDKHISFGPYQFTKFAVYDDGIKRRGASVINQALPLDIQIPGSVSELKYNDHFKAAYLFAIYNLSLAVKDTELNNAELSFLNDRLNNSGNEIMKYIATAHYKPRNARNAFSKWVNDDCYNSYNYYCDDRIIKYADKTDLNINSLIEYKAREESLNFTLRE